MNVGKSVFAQLMSLVPWYEFGKCVDKYGGDYKVQKFTTRQQFLVMCLAQLTRRESLRDIESCLNAILEKLNLTCIWHQVKLSTMADTKNSEITG